MSDPDIRDPDIRETFARHSPTFARADRIVVMHHGRNIDTGTHEELVSRGGLYSRLAELQFADTAA